MDGHDADRLEHIKAAFLFLEKGLFALLALNGGAIVALMTYVAAVWGKSDVFPDGALRITKYVLQYPIYFFLFGLVSTILTYILSYNVQRLYYNRALAVGDEERKINKHSVFCIGFGYVTALLSIFCFVAGVIASSYNVRGSIAQIQQERSISISRTVERADVRLKP